MHPDTDDTRDVAFDHPTGTPDPPAPLDDYSLVNLTKLNWSQPLVASLRLYLSLRTLPVALPIYDGRNGPSGSPLSDEDLKSVIDEAVAPDEESPSGEPERVRLAWRGGIYETAETALLPTQTRLANVFADELDNRGRAGAILAILFTELGWPVKKISKALEVSRPTLNKWVMVHAGTALSANEFEILLDLLESEVGAGDLGYPAPLQLALVDVRTELLRTKRSGLSWQKAAFLPSEEITDIVRALWAVSVRVRGEKSSTDDRMCSYALDMFIDLLLRRGVTAQNLGRIVGVTHAAVLHRWSRSRIRVEGDEYGRDHWVSQDRIAGATGGFVPAGIDIDLMTKDLMGTTATHRRAADEHHEDMLFAVHTHEASDVNTQPLPNVYVLCAVNGLSSIASSSSLSPQVRAEVINRLYELDEAPTGDAMKAVRALAADYADVLRFEPLRVSTRLLGTEFAIDDLILYLDSGGTRVDTLPMSPMSDPVVLPALFDVDRYGFQQTTPHRQWTEGVVLSEVLLVQAVGQYDRNAESEAHGRPGFGQTSHHWVPAEAFGAIIDLVTHDQARERITHLQAADRTFAPEHLQRALERFLPDDARAALERWSREADFAGAESGEAKTVLRSCLTTPHEVVAKYSRPKRRSA